MHGLSQVDYSDASDQLGDFFDGVGDQSKRFGNQLEGAGEQFGRAGRWAGDLFGGGSSANVAGTGVQMSSTGVRTGRCVPLSAYLSTSMMEACPKSPWTARSLLRRRTTLSGSQLDVSSRRGQLPRKSQSMQAMRAVGLMRGS
ncbi:MAG: hypothetical protein AAF219_07125 [Myxococcota bacterium]